MASQERPLSRRLESVTSGQNQAQPEAETNLRPLSRRLSGVGLDATREAPAGPDRQREAIQSLYFGTYRVRPKGRETPLPPDPAQLTRELSKEERVTAEEEKNNLRNLLATAFDRPASQIDLDSGASTFDRIRSSFNESPRETLQYYRDKYGENNAGLVGLAGQFVPYIIKDDKVVLADEYGLSGKDIADLSAAAIPFAAETAGAIAATGPPGAAGRTALSLMARTAGGAGLGRFAGELGVETIQQFVRDPQFQNQNYVQKIGEAAGKGAGSAILDFALAGTGKVGTALAKTPRMIRRRPQDATDVASQRLQEAVEQEGIKPTAGMVGGTTLRETEERVAAGVPETSPVGLVSRGRARVRTEANDIWRNWVNDSDQTFADLIRDGSTFQRQLAETVDNATDGLNPGASDLVSKAIEGEAANYATRIRGWDEIGSDLRENLRTTVRDVTEESDRLYNQAFNIADQDGVAMSLSAAKNPLNKIIGDTVPEDSPVIGRLRNAVSRHLEDDVPMTMRFDPATGQSRRVPERTPQVTMRQLHDARKDINALRNIDDPSGKTQLAINSLTREIDKMMENMAKQGGSEALNTFRAAQNFFRTSVQPIREGGSSKIVKYLDKKIVDGAEEYSLNASALVNDLVSGKESVSTIRQLRGLMPEGRQAEFMNNVREAYLSRILYTTDVDGGIPYSKLTGELTKNTEVNKLLFGENVLPSNLQGFQSILRRFSNDLPKGPNQYPIPKRFVQLASAARTPEAKRRVFNQFQDYVQREIRARTIRTNKLLDNIRQGIRVDSADVELAASLATIRKIPTRDLDKMFELMDEPTREAFNRAFLRDIQQEAMEGGGRVERTALRGRDGELGGVEIWNVDKMSQILNNSKRRATIRKVVGQEGLDRLERLNTILTGARAVRVAESGPMVRGGIGMGGAFGVISNGLSFFSDRLASIALSNRVSADILLTSKSEADVLRLLMPAIVSSNAAMNAMAEEATKDPRFALWLRDNVPGILNEAMDADGNIMVGNQKIPAPTTER